MKIEKHDAHGMELLVRVSPLEALELAERLARTAQSVLQKQRDHYTRTPCEFEDDNDRWVETDFDILVESTCARHDYEATRVE